jgi:hypothetical protein
MFNKWLVRPSVQKPDAWKGRSFSLLLPLIVDGKTENIYVTFLVEDVVR